MQPRAAPPTTRPFRQCAPRPCHRRWAMQRLGVATVPPAMLMRTSRHSLSRPSRLLEPSTFSMTKSLSLSARVVAMCSELSRGQEDVVLMAFSPLALSLGAPPLAWSPAALLCSLSLGAWFRGGLTVQLRRRRPWVTGFSSASRCAQTATLAVEMVLPLWNCPSQFNLIITQRAGGAAATPSHAALAAMSPGKLAPEEEEVLRKKLADLDSVLQAELEDLKTQNVDIYLERFQEAMLVQSKLKELEEQVRLEEEEMRLQERILEIERNENLKYPEPDDARPALSAGDDDFSRQMREYGLTHVSSTNEVKQLRHDLLPPELDLDQFLLMDNPDAGSES
eukprot:m.179513 g.179513  ORF g.179513 m.179513 type:complete len:337 (-) comp10459_c1_seq12:166-1176(-)